MSAFAMGQANRGKEEMVFDWDKAAQLIVERNPKTVEAGLAGDWDYTGGTIWSDGEIIKDSYTFLASTWAIPEISIDGEIFICYKMVSKTPGWNSGTKWPDSAVSILVKAKRLSKLSQIEETA